MLVRVSSVRGLPVRKRQRLPKARCGDRGMVDVATAKRPVVRENSAGRSIVNEAPVANAKGMDA